MGKNLKSLLTSVGLILFYIFATIGIVKLFWDTPDNDVFEARVTLLVLFNIVFGLVFIIASYHIVGPHHVDNLYFGLIIEQTIYSILGIISFIFMEKK